MTERQVLTGGINEVVRIGDRVRRPTGAWSPRVHELLRHLDAQGFRGAPRVHEVTADGFEILDFLPGTVTHRPPEADATVRSAAELLRDYHEATIGHARRAPRDGWQVPAGEPVEVICHGDFAPYNCVTAGERVTGMFDFDHARPGPRILDVAYAVYRWVPLTRPGSVEQFGTPAAQAERLRAFCDAYGLGDDDRARLVDAVADRLHGLVAYMRAQAAAGSAAFAGHLAAGHHVQYLGDAAYVAEQREIFERRIQGSGRRVPEGRARKSSMTQEVPMAFDDKVDNKAEEFGGKVKEGVGRATDNERLEAEGRADQSESKLKQAGEKVKDAGSAVKDAFKS